VVPRRRVLPESSRAHSVVLVHGVLGQGFIYWNLLKRYLSGDRHHFHEVRLPFFGFGDLRQAAVHLGQEVDHILDECDPRTDRDQVDLVAHSAGGLAARYYIKYLGGGPKVHSLITLGTPHHGTLTSALFPLHTVARQTLPGSTFLRELNRGADTAAPVHYTCVWSRTDGVVIPSKSATLTRAHNVEVPFITHWGFLWNREVYRVIREAIDHGAGGYPHYAAVAPRRRGHGAPRT
jgi:triacylglycerol esterase/lipase EstA (alpha/beta hydrolase family)